MKQLHTFPVPELLTETQPFISISFALDDYSAYSEKDSLKLENYLKEAENAVQDLGSSWQKQIEVVRKAERELLTATKSLLLYINEEQVFYYHLNIPVNDQMLFGDGPNIAPLIKHYQFNSDYHLLVLNQDSAHVFEVSQDSIREVKEDKWPLQLTEVLGHEKDGGQLSHSGSAAKGGPGQPGFHGHNETSAEKEIDRENFFRAVDNHLMETFGQESRPLILYSLSENQATFRSISKYLPLMDTGIELSGAKVSIEEIAERASEFIAGYRSQTLTSLSKRFVETKPEYRVNDQLDEIKTLAHENRIDELIIVEDRVLSTESEMDKRFTIKDIVLATYQAKGKVYILDSDQLEGDFGISARLRY
ncbi:hypothetical protein [Streptococcus porcinus]|uniref:baeRF6 domain-containing protein n=1 Tax=Streptococcus porcinus TaxID=1340 RepID=UPI00195F8AB8|nr:hypothetical protein [Streptococcus porcinus]